MRYEEELKAIRVLATDVDGTITDLNRKLDLEAVRVIRCLDEAEIPVILITGHVFPVVSGLASYIGINEPVVAEGGGVVGFPWKIKCMLGDTVPRKAAKIMKNLGFSESESNKYRHVDLAFHREGIRTGVREIQNTLQEHSICVDVRDSGYAVHLAPSGVDKGVGIKKALELIGKDLKYTAVIGDSLFDIPIYILLTLKLKYNY